MPEAERVKTVSILAGHLQVGNSMTACGKHLDLERNLTLTPACPSDRELLQTSMQIYSDSCRSPRLLVLALGC